MFDVDVIAALKMKKIRWEQPESDSNCWLVQVLTVETASQNNRSDASRSAVCVTDEV